MVFKKRGAASFFLLISSFILTGCSQKHHTFCLSEAKPCALPSPPRDQPTIQTNNIVAQKQNQTEQVPSVHSKKLKSHSAPLRHNENANKTTQNRFASVQVIENIRNNSMHSSPPLTKKQSTYIGMSKPNTVEKTGVAAHIYTIQLGAYRLADSRNYDIKRLNSTDNLYVFTMKNHLLGLAYGRFTSIKEAKEKKPLLIKQGFNEFQFRRLPSNATALIR
jgi:hypothetical protein